MTDVSLAPELCASPEPDTVIILGVPFHRVTRADTLASIDQIIQRKKPSYVVTANMDFAAQASRDVELHKILLDADMVLCDGTPLVWASRFLDAPLPERVAGSDLVPDLCERAASKGYKLFFLGADSDTLEVASTRLEKSYPGIRIVGGYSPPIRPLHEFDSQEIARRIKEASPDILLVAFGCPKQEKWIHMNYQALGVPCSIGVGATLEFVAGKFSRAPNWMKSCGLEWVYRLLQEPKRLIGRYWFDLVFFVKESRAHHRFQKEATIEHTKPGTSQCTSEGDYTLYEWKGRIDAVAIKTGDVEKIPQVDDQKIVLLDLGQVTFMDSSGLGHLVHCYKKCGEVGQILILLRPSNTVSKLLRLHNLHSLIPTVNCLGEVQSVLRKIQFSINEAVEETAECLTLKCKGRLTADTAIDYRKWIDQEWGSHPRVRKLELDLKDVSFMDSAGLGFLLYARKLVSRRRDGECRLSNVSENPRNVISLARLDRVFGLAA